MAASFAAAASAHETMVVSASCKAAWHVAALYIIIRSIGLKDVGLRLNADKLRDAAELSTSTK